MPLNSFSPALKDAQFETIFQWNGKWTSIHVTPLSRMAGKSYFKVQMVDNSQVYIWKTAEENWEEHTGTTSRSRTFGSAIDTFYVCSDIYLA